MTLVRCPACEAPLADGQRWCLACGARQPSAGPRALLFGAAQPPAADVAPTKRPVATAGSIAARRRRVALPVALAALAGLVVMSGTGAPTSVAGDAPPPVTVTLPEPVAQADEPPPAVEEPVAPAPGADATADPPAAAAPAAGDDTAPAAGTDETPSDDAAAGDPEPIEHVFVIALADTDVAALARDARAAPYLAGTLAKSGTLLPRYRTVADGGLADLIALVSGRTPASRTPATCVPRTDGGAGANPPGGDADPAGDTGDSQPGTGTDAAGDRGEDPPGGDDGEPATEPPADCVYVPAVRHLGDQLVAHRRTWKAYVEPAAAASGTGPLARAAAACAAGAETSRRNPFLWFAATVEADDCDERNVPLARLREDLRTAAATPALAWVASDAQRDAVGADRLLRRVVPRILRSPAYAAGGLIAIVGDAAGDRPAGALLISPNTPRGEVDATATGAFGLLRTLQAIFGLRPLGDPAARRAARLPDAVVRIAP
jgi:hypothetical protein